MRIALVIIAFAGILSAAESLQLFNGKDLSGWMRPLSFIVLGAVVGAGATGILAGREVSIWPDNDAALSGGLETYQLPFGTFLAGAALAIAVTG